MPISWLFSFVSCVLLLITSIALLVNYGSGVGPLLFSSGLRLASSGSSSLCTIQALSSLGNSGSRWQTVLIVVSESGPEFDHNSFSCIKSIRLQHDT
ncbi:uncharacterized protein BDR25DRAFT_361904 [Lindgomyces ingoldianus]|uniref:Uncharacterized protein n=1 Tax=Lindgomyces ingoldianus TaxID=673940 RepID=A0ACB6QB70_9PLEO|nr:uncharacterized protein BDR25DRAFT_361904 [Lindgomyces ingoldianus]KAF2464162.1 hypothetical protein BDR25DRAFT_361904 [Lindgomyces ingoldianus]